MILPKSKGRQPFPSTVSSLVEYMDGQECEYLEKLPMVASMRSPIETACLLTYPGKVRCHCVYEALDMRRIKHYIV